MVGRCYSNNNKKRKKLPDQINSSSDHLKEIVIFWEIIF